MTEATRCVILLAHGSPDPRHLADVTGIAARVEINLGDPWRVRVAFLQHHGPTLGESVVTSSSQGNATLIYPLFLTGGIHWRKDVPKALQEVAATSSRGCEPVLLPPPDPAGLAEAVIESLTATPPQANPARSATTPAPVPQHVLLVPSGSRRNDVVAHFKTLATTLAADRRMGILGSKIPITVLADPAALADSEPSGASTVVPLLVSRGHIEDDVIKAAHSSQFPTTSVIGGTKAFAAMIASTVRAQQTPS